MDSREIGSEVRWGLVEQEMAGPSRKGAPQLGTETGCILPGWLETSLERESEKGMRATEGVVPRKENGNIFPVRAEASPKRHHPIM